MPARSGRILLVDDDKNFRKVTTIALEEAGFGVTTAGHGGQALEVLDEELPDVILCDLNMPVMDGMSFLAELGGKGIDVPVIVVTAYGSIESAVDAMRSGAFNYVTKPINRQELQLAIEKAIDVGTLRQENRLLRERVAGGRAVDRIIGSNQTMIKLRETLVRLAEADVPVLITGESGVGKELVARALHYDGPRSGTGNFVVINCAAVPGDLLESVLFGHRKGAFTGAASDRRGKFQAADDGTLFLDEIGDMPLDLQAKLLRALQEGEIERIGDTKPIPVNVRVVSATNQPLEQRIADGRFRQDLYYRLAVVPVEVPPLRDRIDDLPALLRHFFARHGAAGVDIADEVLAELQSRQWPGNVRELENLVMRVSALDPGLAVVTGDHVQPPRPEPRTAPNLADLSTMHLPPEGLRFEDVERHLLIEAWEMSGRNQTRGAELLGLPRQAFSYRLQKFGIIPKHHREGRTDEP